MTIKVYIMGFVLAILVCVLCFCLVELFFRLIKKKRDKSIISDDIDIFNNNNSDKHISSNSNVGKSILKAKEDMRSKL